MDAWEGYAKSQRDKVHRSGLNPEWRKKDNGDLDAWSAAAAADQLVLRGWLASARKFEFRWPRPADQPHRHPRLR